MTPQNANWLMTFSIGSRSWGARHAIRTPPGPSRKGCARRRTRSMRWCRPPCCRDEALKRAHSRIQELEGGEGEQQQSGGFLDSMRDAIFGQTQSRGSVPNVRPPEVGSRPAWNTGQVLQQGRGPGQYNQKSIRPGSIRPALRRTAGACRRRRRFVPWNRGSGGGRRGRRWPVMSSIRSMMGGAHQSGFGDSAGLGGGGGGKPWSFGSVQQRSRTRRRHQRYRLGRSPRR